jgi:Sensors of blue-light using FAD
MYELIYCSMAKRHLKPEDISAILETAHKFNAKHHITGCLLFHNNEFIQILEGEKKLIKGLHTKILKDPRHFNVSVLAEGEKEQRTFTNWSMAYRELSSDEVENLSDSLFVDNLVAFSDLASKPTRAIRIFWSRAKRLLTDNYTT